MRLDKR